MRIDRRALRAWDVPLICAVAISLTYVGVVTWLTRHGVPLTPDGAEYAEVARSLVQGEGFTLHHVSMHPGLSPSIRVPPELHGLLEPILIAPFFALFGPSAALVRLPGAIAMVALAVFAFWFVRRRFGMFGAAAAGTFFLTHPAYWYLGLLAADDLPFGVLSVTALGLFVAGVDEPNERYVAWSGIFAGLATLAKFNGCAIAVACWAALALRRLPRPRLATWLWTGVPVMVAVSLYWLRNYAAHGGVGFRFTAIDWLSKNDPHAYFAYYPRAPRVSEVWAELGRKRVLELIVFQLKALTEIVKSNWVVFLGGPVALAVFGRSRAFVVSVALYVLATMAVVCVPYHVEPRYLTAVTMLFGVSLAGAVQCLGSQIAARIPHRIAVALGACAVVVGGVMSSRRVALVANNVDVAAMAPGKCDGAIGFLRSTTTKRDAVLTSNPWIVSWQAERAAVMTPTGGAAALSTVVRHYGTDWVLVGAGTYWAPRTDETFAALRAKDAELRPVLAYDSAECNVYHLTSKPSETATVTRPGW